MNYLMKILLVLSVSLFFSCGDVANDVDKDGDFVDITKDSNVSKFDTNYTYVRAKGLKSSFKVDGNVTYEDKDTIAIFKIGSYSVAEFSIAKGKALTKASANGEEYVKLEINGESFDEYGTTGNDFNEITLTAYTLVEDSINVVLNPVNHMISALFEKNNDFDSSKAYVLSDLSLDSGFNVNTDWDSFNSDPVSSGKMVAIGGLLMRQEALKNIPLSDWDILPYENNEDSLKEFKHWSTFIDSSNIIFGYFHPYPTQDTAKAYNDDLNDYYSICDTAYSRMNSKELDELRNIVFAGISEETRDYCKEYIRKIYVKNVPKSIDWLY